MVLMATTGRRSVGILVLRIGAFVGKLACLAGIVALGACAAVPQGRPDPAPRPLPVAKTTAPRPVPASRPIQRPTAPPAARPAEVSRALESAIRSLGAGFSGTVGIAVRDVHQDWIIDYNGRQLMPQQSVSKLWVGLTLLDAVDKGRVGLSDPVTVRAQDLTLFHQPIRALVGANGHSTTIANLLDRAMTQSDNTANDVLLNKAGGPAAVRALLQRNGLTDVRFGPGERLLQSGTAGLTWRQEYSRGNAFQVARAALPAEKRQAAMARYLADPIDGASAIGIVNGLARLKRGEMLSSRSTDYLLRVMAESRTGPQRLKGGLAPGWTFAHKTGTGQELAGRSTGYNDVALLTAPDGRTYAVAVLIGQTRRPIPERMALMQAVTRAIIAHH
jgi:beta-lactamase class A